MDSFLCMLESLLSLEQLKVKSARSELVKKLAVSVKQQCLLEVNKDKLELFSAEYTDTLKSVQEATPQPQAIDREKMWTQ